MLMQTIVRHNILIIEKMYLVLGKGPTQGLEDITITGEASHSNNFTERTNKFYLSLDYNGSNIFLYVNGVNQFQTKTF